jgi:hypothetical protein
MSCKFTPRRSDYMFAIESHWRRYGFAPTTRWLGKYLGVVHSGIQRMVVKLRRVGLIARPDVKQQTGSIRTTRMKFRPAKNGYMVFWR